MTTGVFKEPISYLTNNFYTTPKLSRQIMTYKEWQSTAKATQCKIISCGETWNLHVKHIGGGIYEVTAQPNYWTEGKSSNKLAKAKGG